MNLQDLLTLPGASLDAAIAVTGADPGTRESVRGYESLKRVDAMEAPDGTTIYIRGDDVQLVYVGEDALPAGVSHDALVAVAGSEGERLRSRQGKKARMHVVADRGIAWSEERGEVGFVELFPPTTLADYQRTIYREPMPFRR